MKFDSAIFDLDGTLWDSTDTVLKAWNTVLRQVSHLRGPLTKEELQSVFGMLLPDIGVRFLPMMDEEPRAALLAQLGVTEQELLRREGGRLYDGLERMLAALSAKIPLFIVSNCQSGYIASFLEHHRLGRYFRDTECAGRTGRPKCDNIRLIVGRNGLKSPVYVGDTALDNESAQKAGVPFIHAAYGFGTVPGCYARVDAVAQLTNYIPGD